MTKSLAAAIIVAVLAAGCGGGPTASTSAQTTRPKQRTAAAARFVRDYKRLWADVRALRAEALKVHRQTLLGTPGLRRTTGKFIEDLETSVLPPKARNRMIDHAASTVATSCDQCFQMLEAVRPIPQIAGH